MILAAATACTALGDSPHVEGAIRAGLDRFREDDTLLCRGHDPAWDPEEPSRTVRVLPPGLPGRQRLRHLTNAAGRDLATRAGLRRSDLPRTALVVALPAAIGPAAGWKLPKFGATVAATLGLHGLPVVETLATGRLALFDALDRAGVLLAGGGITTVLIIVADTLLDDEAFAALDAARRIRSSRSPAGMLPGEAAVGLVVRSSGTGPHLGVIGRGQEPQVLGGPQASSGKGLSEAVRAANATSAAFALPDLTSEDYRTREWSVVVSRLGLALQATRPICANLGDCGAANPALALITAAAALTRGWATGDALITAGADDGARAAMLLTAAAPPATNGAR